MKSMLINLAKLIGAKVLLLTIGAIAFLWVHVKAISRGVRKNNVHITFRYLSGYYWMMAFAEDQKGNVLCRDMFNDLLLTPEGTKTYPYGNPDMTVSHVTGVNELEGRLTWLGHFVAWVLNLIEHNHTEMAAKNNQYNG